MVALLDDLGIWNDLGTIVPDGNWQNFPGLASQGLSVFRVTWGGDLSKVGTRVYLRSVYVRSGFAEPDSRWRRLYPKQGSEIVFLHLPDELKSQSIDRAFQVTKRSKYRRIGRTIDSQYSINLQEFQPFPQFDRDVRPLTPSTVEEIVLQALANYQPNF